MVAGMDGDPSWGAVDALDPQRPCRAASYGSPCARARWSWRAGAFRSFGIELSVHWPEWYPGAAHFATLTLQGQPIAVSALGDSEGLTPAMLEGIAMIQQWGYAGGDDGDRGPDYVVYGLVGAGRPELIRELPELQRWVRSSGKSVEMIAAAYAEIVKRDQDWKP